MQQSDNIKLIVAKVAGQFLHFGGGEQPLDKHNLVAMWAQEKPPMFAAGVDIEAVVRAVLLASPTLRQIDQLKLILDSQDPAAIEQDKWPKLDAAIQPLPIPERLAQGGLEVSLKETQVAFVFDPTGEKFQGVYNWKE